MSKSPEFNPIPAFELTKALYRQEQAKKCYEYMSDSERETVHFITNCLKKRLEERLQNIGNFSVEEPLPPTMVIDNNIFSDKYYPITHNVKDYFAYLGYNSQLYPSNPFMDSSAPVLIINWR